MCGIAGFCDFEHKLNQEYEKSKDIVENMGKTMRHRGPDDFHSYVGESVAFAHARLAVIDPERGIQPMVRKRGDDTYVIVYNGELYNTEEIRRELKQKGYIFTTMSDTEVLLIAYMEYGPDCVQMLNGIYSFAIWDSKERYCFLCRDRFGVKPLFYTRNHNVIAFASEIKALFQYPGVKPVIDRKGICEIFGVGPARTPGVGVWKNINELQPGYAAFIEEDGMKTYCYWSLTANEHIDSYEKTVEKTRVLLLDTIKRQLISDVPLCTLLSGGLDSSIISAVAAQVLKRQGKVLSTYSFDFTDNSKYFKASSFQPAEDRPYVDKMVNAIGSKHTYLECNSTQLADCLYGAVLAKDLPGMADVDSSLLHFCRGVKEKHTVCLSGECADEVFGGYPWFRDPEIYRTKAFPWSKNLDFRKEMIKKEVLQELDLDGYVEETYENTISKVPKLSGESQTAARQREISYLNTSWFMATLLDRKDRMSMASGLEVRVPYADHRLIQYLYNIPWEYKYHNQEVKGLLRDAMEGILPDEVLRRKKSPYPKTYNPQYENILKDRLNKVMDEPASPLHQLVNTSAVEKLMNEKPDYGRPWFGQLMAVPQMYAYLIEINYWMEHYKVSVEL